MAKRKKTKRVGDRGPRYFAAGPGSHSSSEDDTDSVVDDLDSQHPAPILPLSTFQPVPDQNIWYLSAKEVNDLGLSECAGTSATLLALCDGDAVTLLGVYTITVLRGSLHISGVKLEASRTIHRVFAPSCSPLPALTYASGEGDILASVQLPVRVRAHLPQECAVVLVQDLQTGVEGLERVCQTFRSVFTVSERQLQDAERNLGVSGACLVTIRTPDIQPFILPHDWDEAMSSVVPDDHHQRAHFDVVVCLVKGPKRSGKSTFARTLLNRLTTRYRKVAFLECDTGQSEFTPAGMVSLNIIESPLFGPPFTHPSLPHVAHYLGSTTPLSSPSDYLSAIQALVQSYHLEIQSQIETPTDDDPRISDIIPLVVNTMGWTKGLGLDLMQKIEVLVEATDLFEIENPAPEFARPRSPLPSRTLRAHKLRTHLLQPIASSLLPSRYTPADYRNLSILSYFHAVFPSVPKNNLQQVTVAHWDASLPLCAQPPYQVDWTVALDKVILTGAGAEDVVPAEVGRVLNGAIVGLVACELGMVAPCDPSSAQVNSALPYVQGQPAPSPWTSTCHGLALVRAISGTTTHLHVLTPLPPQLLGKCRVAVKGELELPVWGMLDFRSADDGVAGVEQGKVPFLQWGKGEGLGAERRRVRRNLMRWGQM